MVPQKFTIIRHYLTMTSILSDGLKNLEHGPTLCRCIFQMLMYSSVVFISIHSDRYYWTTVSCVHCTSQYKWIIKQSNLAKFLLLLVVF